MKNTLCILCCALALVACKTPQVALDEANHGVKLIGELEKSLGEYRRVETNSLNARRDSIRKQVGEAAAAEKFRKFSQRTLADSGGTTIVRTVEKISRSADTYATDDIAYQVASAETDAAIASLMTPLPVTTDASTAAQTALALLGDELSDATRRQELAEFLKTVKESVDQAKVRIATAENDATDSIPKAEAK